MRATKEDFKEPFFSKGQVLTLSDDTFKVFCSNKEQNKNALVFEPKLKTGKYNKEVEGRFGLNGKL